MSDPKPIPSDAEEYDWDHYEDAIISAYEDDDEEIFDEDWEDTGRCPRCMGIACDGNCDGVWDGP